MSAPHPLDIPEQVLAQMDAAAIITDRRGCILWANKAQERLSGYSLEEMRGHRPSALLHGPATDADAVRMARQAIDQGRPFALDMLNYRKDGSTHWVRVKASPIREPSTNEVLGFIGISTDIDAEKRALQAKADNERLLQEILDSVPAGIAVFDRQERLLLVNDAWRKARPISSPHVFPGMTIEEMLRAGVMTGQYALTIDQNNKYRDIESYIQESLSAFRAGGKHRERLFAGSQYFLIEENITRNGHIISVSMNITELKRSQTLLQEILDSLAVAILVVDPEERLVLANRAYRTLAPGLAKRMRPGMPLAEMARIAIDEGDLAPEIPPDAPEEVKQQCVNFLLDQFRNPGRLRQRHVRDGRSVQLSERRSPSGYVVSAGTDITELMTTMRELTEARDQARAAMEAKSRFLARMGHELRTPLNAVIGFGELLEADRTLAPKQREQVRLIAEAGRHLLELINDLLDLAKIDAGKLELVDRPFDLPALLASTAELMAAQAQRKRIELRRDLAPGLPRQVRGDATRLRQVLLNLLSNAVKFAPAEGRVALRAAAEPAAAADGKTLLRIEVEDSGPGIPEDRLPGLFREFERFTPSTEPGTGLGLAISARLVKAMGGRIACDSEPGHGALFRVEIPLATVEGAEAIPASTTPGRTPSGTPGRPLRVLVVDDVAANRALARTMLAAAGHAVELAEDGETAVAAVASGDFDVVLMDVEMPGIGGLEAARRIRALPAPRGRVPIIALSAAALPEQVEACREAGMDGHLAKPMRGAELLSRLAEAASGGERERSKSSAAEALMRQALSELERELGEAVASLLSNVAGEFRLGREVLKRAAEEGMPSSSLRQTLGRLAASARMVGADALATASDRLLAAIEADQGWREALPETRAALDAALAGLDAWFAARASASRSG